MTDSSNTYIPVRRRDLEVGKPIAWDVYDLQHNLLLKQGFVATTQVELDVLIRRGLVRVFDPRGIGESKIAAQQSSPEKEVPLDEIKLAIGDPFQIQTQTDQSDDRYYVSLVGYSKNRSVLVTIPEIEGRLCSVREGQSFVVRFFAGRNAYAFTSTLLKASNVPFPHMHLSYPRQVRGLVVRDGERVAVKIVCAIAMREETQTATAAGQLTNLSVGGALLTSNRKLGNAGDLVAVKFRLQIRDIEVLMAIDATIRSIARKENNEFQYGVQFAGLPNDIAIALTAFVYQKLAESAR
ncbi:MAG TPA: flagellar brake protein [Accumulibacter sp.]|jgi:c-di-GMP-binding flagellar brake protein YcgR|nr:flagellar brake protein [Accumulibacter sp.]HQC80933.1 flagellar brake protein [Accumulibacter sp.]